ncbi:hypothetical protein [Alcanivorax sp.]|uniref:hypothetical protein n=1 Tax=Alcanivorax sp. TaxID=1872427 RepID=UPI002B26A1EC|nr:hypothetical protein [Alcanivorax sp.]
MSLSSLSFGFGQALAWLVDERLIGQRGLSLKTAYVFIWLAKNANPLVPGMGGAEGQRELAARIGISEPTLAKALASLQSAELISGLRTNGQGKKEFSIANIPASPLHFRDGKFVVAENIILGAAGEGLSKGSRVMAGVLVYLSDRVGFIGDQTEQSLALILNIEGKKVLRILRELEDKGFLVFSRESKRGFDFDNGNGLIIKFSLRFLMRCGWNTNSKVVGVINYAQLEGGLCPEGVSGQLNGLVKIGRDEGGARWLNEEYSFGKKYLLYPPMLWPRNINLYYLNRPEGWVDVYEEKHGFFPVEVLKEISGFHAVLIDELFLSVSAKLLAEFYFDINNPDDNVLSAACLLIGDGLKQYFVKPGYRDSSVDWVVEELAVCLIRQAQRGYEILTALGGEVNRDASCLECGRAFRFGKLNTYEVYWVLTNNLSEREDKILDLERSDGSVVIYSSD